MTGIISSCSIRKTLPSGCEIASMLGFASKIIASVLILIIGITIVWVVGIGVGVRWCYWGWGWGLFVNVIINVNVFVFIVNVFFLKVTIFIKF